MHLANGLGTKGMVGRSHRVEQLIVISITVGCIDVDGRRGSVDVSSQDLSRVASVDPSPDGVEFEPLTQVGTSTCVAPTVLNHPFFDTCVAQGIVCSDGQDIT